MKKTSILLFVLLNACIHFTLIAQSDKSKFYIGGNYNLDFSSNKRTFKSSVNSYEMEKNTSVEFSPFIGYFILKNLSLGIKLDYNLSNQLVPNGLGDYNRNSSNSILIIPSIRYYFINANIKPFIQVGSGIGWEKLVQSYYQTSNLKHNNFLTEWELWGGISFSIKSNISLELGLGYNTLTVNYKDKMSSGGYNKWQNVVRGPKSTIGIVFLL